MGIPFRAFEGLDELGIVETALREARERSGPVAILIEMLED
jgi:hypothetical protein